MSQFRALPKTIAVPKSINLTHELLMLRERELQNLLGTLGVLFNTDLDVDTQLQHLHLELRELPGTDLTEVGAIGVYREGVLEYKVSIITSHEKEGCRFHVRVDIIPQLLTVH